MLPPNALRLVLWITDLLGPGVLFAFVAGRYYHPRLEERVLLFIDMRASTTIAEHLGEVRFLDFLNRFITDLSLAIAEAGGEIHKYVATRSSPPGRSPPARIAPAACAPVLPPSTASPRGAPPTSAILAAALIFALGFIEVRSS